MKNEIILYRPNELAEHVEVRFDKDTAWLTQAQMAELFGRTKQNISLHISNVFSEGELMPEVAVKEYLTTTQHGAIKGKMQTTNVKHYNLDVIISVGYRVKSQQGTQFRMWATKILRDYLLKGYAMNTRMDRIEDNAEALKSDANELRGRVDEIELQLNTRSIPTQGVIFEGQVFDAYTLFAEIIRMAKHSIVLIDNYIDDNTLVHLSKKKSGVKVTLLTQSISPGLALDVQKANTQYGDFDVKQFGKSHDRFLILDNGKEVYHIGASLKDLGIRWFAFQKMNKESVDSIISAISGLI